MLKRIIVFCLIFALLCTSAYAQDECVHFQLTIHQSGTDTNCNADLISVNDRILIVSDLFPGSFISIPLPDEVMSFNSPFSISAFSTFSSLDYRPILKDWYSGLSPAESTGFYSGDLFELSTQMAAGTCKKNDLILLAESLLSFSDSGRDFVFFNHFEQLYNSGFFDSVVSSEAEYRIYDSGNYFSLTGKQGDKTLYTLSLDLSDPSHQRILYGYVNNSQNYYRYAEMNFISDHEVHLMMCFYTDDLQTGFRSVEALTPVVRENWTFSLSDDQRSIDFSAEIEPQNDLNNILVAGSILAGETLRAFADITFRDAPDSSFTFSAEITHKSLSFEDLHEVSLEDLSNITLDSAFAQELTDNVISVYTSFLFALPAKYIEKIINLN